MKHIDESNGSLLSVVNTLKTVETAPVAKRIAQGLLKLFLALILFLGLTPWQQNVRGIGASSLIRLLTGNNSLAPKWKDEFRNGWSGGLSS